MVATRIFENPGPATAVANIERRHAIEGAAWLWHPDVPAGQVAHLVFRCRFSLPEAKAFKFHVTADQRYEMRFDGQLLSRGPDRSDVYHWCFASYLVELPAGDHMAEATVWWEGPHAPLAQTSLRGGFLCAAEGLENLLNTGQACWEVIRLDGIKFRPPLRGHFHAVGPGYDVDLAVMKESLSATKLAVALPKSWHSNPEWWHWGTILPDWALAPSPLPDQLAERRQTARVRAVYVGDNVEQHQWRGRPGTESDGCPWNRMLGGVQVAVVPGHMQVHVLLDLGDYYCGYPEVEVAGGKGAKITLQWAESLFSPVANGVVPEHKGQRGDVEGKIFFGFGDRWILDGEPARLSSFWWRAGRYQLLSVETDQHPLTISRLAYCETRYPLAVSGAFACSDRQLQALQPMLQRSILCSLHETLADSPYYEQMMYVGDARVELLCIYIMSADRRPARRAIELFDWSRWRTGLIAQRYPSDPFQLSLTFSMLWVGMVNDFSWWENDAAFVRQRLLGVRGILEQLWARRNSNGLLAMLPGWSFVDWVHGDGWINGVPPGEQGRGSASVNLQFLRMILDVAELERNFGDAMLAARAEAFATELGASIRLAFWDPVRNLFGETVERVSFSQHAQVLAVLCGLERDEAGRQLLTRAIESRALAPCSLYFTHYLIEAARQVGLGGAFFSQIPRWETLRELGLATTAESETNPRSDCHGWSAHPLFHFVTTVAGVRPAAPGFHRVAIRPMLGHLQEVETTAPHPRGPIMLRLNLDGGSLRGVIELPPDTDGFLEWSGQQVSLGAGSNPVSISNKTAG